MSLAARRSKRLKPNRVFSKLSFITENNGRLLSTFLKFIRIISTLFDMKPFELPFEALIINFKPAIVDELF